MARLFTTPFSFRKETYTAFVSITTCNGERKVSVLLQDTSLHRLVPGGQFTFDPEKGLPLEGLHHAEARELMVSVMEAIEAYGVQLSPSSPTSHQH